MVYYTASKFHIILGRFGEAIPSVLFLWNYRTEIDRFDELEAKE
jgi:hypothetical protein